MATRQFVITGGEHQNQFHGTIEISDAALVISLEGYGDIFALGILDVDEDTDKPGTLKPETVIYPSGDGGQAHGENITRLIEKQCCKCAAIIADPQIPGADERCDTCAD